MSPLGLLDHGGAGIGVKILILQPGRPWLPEMHEDLRRVHGHAIVVGISPALWLDTGRDAEDSGTAGTA